MTNKEAAEFIWDVLDGVKSFNEEGGKGLEALDLAIKALKNERPEGKWIKWNFKTFGGLGDWEYKCSNCEKVYSGEYNFCPNCGANMYER